MSPHYALEFFLIDPKLAFLALGSVVLAVTGAEALYADMGHFGRRAIMVSWLYIAFPCLLLNYLGQSALLLHTPSAAENPFFLMAPEWARLPLVLLATAATVIASQAVISGAFSVSQQAVQLGFLPRIRGHGLYRMIARHGFMDEVDIPAELAQEARAGGPFKAMDTSYFLARRTLIASRRPGMAIWREKLFAWMVCNAETAMEFFKLPSNRVIELGSQVEI